MTITTIHPQMDKVLESLWMAHKIYNQINTSDNCPNREIYRRLEDHTSERLSDFAEVFKIDQSEIELSFLEQSKVLLDKVTLELHGLLIEYSDKRVLEYCIKYEHALNNELRTAMEEAAFVKEEREVLAVAVITSTSLLSELRKSRRTYEF